MCLKKLSIVDCNDLKQVQLAEFNSRFIRKDIELLRQRFVAILAQRPT